MMQLELHILRNRSRREALDFLSKSERAELTMYAHALGLAGLHKASRNAYIAAIVAATHPLQVVAEEEHQVVQEGLW